MVTIWIIQKNNLHKLLQASKNCYNSMKIMSSVEKQVIFYIRNNQNFQDFQVWQSFERPHRSIVLLISRVSSVTI